MKKIFSICLIMICFASVRVRALDYYFYKSPGADGSFNYTLCEGDDNNCRNYTTSRLESMGAIINDDSISFGPGGTVYYNKSSVDSSLNNQPSNNNNSSSYYFYLSPGSNGTNNYTLCDGSDDKCQDYTKSQLESMGAGITDSSINFGPGGNVYYYKSSVRYLDPGITSPGDANSSDTTPSKVVKEPVTDTCTRLKEPLKFIGHIVTIFKIIIPILLIAFGMMDFFKAVTAGKDEEIKKSVKTFALRVLAGVVIFFLPTIVSFIFSMIDSWAEFEGDFNACQRCVFRVSKCE